MNPNRINVEVQTRIGDVKLILNNKPQVKKNPLVTRVLLMRAGKRTTTDDLYFVDVVKFLKKKVYIKILQSNPCQKRYSLPPIVGENDMIGNWFPDSIYGFFRTPLFILRSWYIAFWSIFMNWSFNPQIIFVDASPLIYPFLKLIYRCPIIEFAHYQELLCREFCMNARLNSHITEYCRMWSDNALVPCDRARLFYSENRYGCPFVPTVLYPPCNGERVTGRHNLKVEKYNENDRSEVLMVALGPFEARSNFITVVKAFYFIYNSSVMKNKERCSFIIAGYMEEDNLLQERYYDELLDAVKEYPAPFISSLMIRVNLSAGDRSVIYQSCMFILNLTEQDDFNWVLLEAQFFGRPVIALETEFSLEILQHGGTGYFVDLIPICIGYEIYYLLNKTGVILGENAFQRYRQMNSVRSRDTILRQFLQECLPNELIIYKS